MDILKIVVFFTIEVILVAIQRSEKLYDNKGV